MDLPMRGIAPPTVAAIVHTLRNVSPMTVPTPVP
jgi:hypothetical protein